MKRPIVLRGLLVLAASSTPVAQDLPDPLNDLEVQAGWRLLFNGTDTQGWRGFTTISFPDRGWSVREGALVHAKGGGGGDIVTVGRYENFELEFEWRVTDGANSGVKYRVPPAQSGAMLGPEYQILDNGGTKESANQKHAAGALYDVIPAGWTPRVARGGFNRGRIVARDATIEHWVDGERLLAANLGSREWASALEDSKFAKREGFGRGSGHIGLQDHGDEAWFRNIRIRDWDHMPGRTVQLFDGDDLVAWRDIGDAVYRPDEKSILGEVGGGGQSFLITKRNYGDFIFEVDVKPELPGNSGIQVRSNIRNPNTRKQRLYGYQIEIDSSERAWSGGLYDEARRGWLDNLEDNPAGRMAFRYNEWNRYRIECIGPSIKAWVNGIPTADYVDCQDMEGVIGLQVHSGNNTRVRWAHLRLRDLGIRFWEDTGQLSVEEGVMLLTPSNVESWRDFALRMRFDGGAPFVISLRTKQKGFPLGEGEERAPGLTRFPEGPNPGWGIDPFHSAHAELFSEGKNELTLACYGRRLVMHLNGKLAFDYRPSPLERPSDGDLEGMLGLWPAEGTELAIENIQSLGPPEFRD